MPPRSASLLLAAPLALSLSHDCTARAAVVQPDPSAQEIAAREAELGKQAAAFFEAFINNAPVVSPDGQAVAFVSNRDGLPQLYLAQTADPSSPTRRLVTSTERVSTPDFTPDGAAVVYRSDHGADENWAFFRYDLAAGTTTALTPGETLQRDPALLPKSAAGRMFYSARKLSEAATSVFEASSTGAAKPRLVYRDELPAQLADVSGDGRWGLLVRFPTASDMHLLRLDLSSGQAKQIYPASGQVSIFEADLSPDGSRVYVATDGGAEQALVLTLEAQSGREVGRYLETKPASAEINAVAIDPGGRLLAIGLTAGSHSVVRFLDAASLRPLRDADLPLGTGGFDEFTADGRLPVTWSTPASPGDVLTVDPATGKPLPLRRETRPTLAGWPPPEVSIETVEAFDGLDLPINVYLPAGSEGKKLPVMVAYHGGPAGVSQTGWSAHRAFYLSQGYAWVEPNVRGSSGYGRAFEEADNGPRRLDAFRDIEASARWVAARPWADPHRLVVFGGSYGGYTVLVGLTRFPDIWRAGIDLFGVANMHTFMASTSGLIHKIFLLEFGDPVKDATFFETISPLRDVDRIVDPLFVYAGANDPRVPRSESDLIVAGLRQRNVPVEYMVKDNEGHSLARRENQIEFAARTARFLERVLR